MNNRNNRSFEKYLDKYFMVEGCVNTIKLFRPLLFKSFYFCIWIFPHFCSIGNINQSESSVNKNFVFPTEKRFTEKSEEVKSVKSFCNNLFGLIQDSPWRMMRPESFNMNTKPILTWFCKPIFGLLSAVAVMRLPARLQASKENSLEPKWETEVSLNYLTTNQKLLEVLILTFYVFSGSI